MSGFRRAVVAFLRDEDGPTPTEYTVQLFFIVVVCMSAFNAIASRAQNTFGKVTTAVKVSTGS
jgi:pilus assembly protein Flp/PilA